MADGYEMINTSKNQHKSTLLIYIQYPFGIQFVIWEKEVVHIVAGPFTETSLVNGDIEAPHITHKNEIV